MATNLEILNHVLEQVRFIDQLFQDLESGRVTIDSSSLLLGLKRSSNALADFADYAVNDRRELLKDNQELLEMNQRLLSELKAKIKENDELTSKYSRLALAFILKK